MCGPLLSNKDSGVGKGKQVRKKHQWFWLVLLIIALLGCQGKSKPKMENLNMISHRAGRLIVDLPDEFRSDGGATATFTPRGNNALATKMEVQVVSSDTSRQKFDNAVALHKLELLKAGPDDENALKETLARPDGSVLFRMVKVGNAYISELNQLVGDVHVRITAASYHGTYEKVEGALFQFAALIVPLAAGKASDFVLDTVSVGGINVDETAQFYYRSTRRPDLRIEIAIDTFQPDADKPLLARMSGDASLLKVFDVNHRTVRKGELTVAGMHAQEWLGVARLGKNNDTEYNFVLETLRPAPGPFRPAMQLQLMSGQYDVSGVKLPNSLDDDKALQLWDPIIKSVRTAGGF
jgi:hypothetical protein